MTKQPYYPNNWRAFKDAPDETFETLTFDEFMDWKIGGWELPSSCNYIIREQNLNTGKIKDAIGQETINVFVPTTPNPTSGFLLMFPKKDVIFLKSLVE